MAVITQTNHNANYGPSGLISSADVDVDVTEQTNRATLYTQAQTALTNLRTYVALTSPTAAQTTAAVKLNSQVNIALIRLVIGQLEATG